MFDFWQKSQELFGALIFCNEAVKILDAEYETTIGCLPREDVLEDFLNKFEDRDQFELSMESTEDFFISRGLVLIGAKSIDNI